MRYFAISLGLALISGGVAASAQGLRATQPLPGYACMSLNLTPTQMRDDRFQVKILAQPNPNAQAVAVASAIVIASDPPHVTNGYREVLRLNGSKGWIAENMLAPYRSASNPNAKCTPAIMSNGRPGFSTGS